MFEGILEEGPPPKKKSNHVWQGGSLENVWQNLEGGGSDTTLPQTRVESGFLRYVFRAILGGGRWGP